AAQVADVLRQSRELEACVSRATTLAEADELIARGGLDVALLDLALPDGDGCDWLQRKREQGEALPGIVLSEIEAEPVTVAARSAGAEDYVVKTASAGNTLPRAIRYALERHHGRQQLEQTGRRFRHLIENALDLIAIVNAEGTVEYASPAAERLLGM